MCDLDEIEKLLGSEHVEYARNKRNGARNSVEGRKFELLYAFCRIAELAATALSLGRDGTDTFIREQIVGFVDDLLVERAGASTFSQIRHVQELSWVGGRHPLADDFRLQRTLMQRLAREAAFEIVVSRPEVYVHLARKRPRDLGDVRIVQQDHGRIPEDLHRIPRLIGWLEELCHPFTDEETLSNASEYLLSAWCLSGGGARLKDLIDKASRMSRNVVRPLGPEYELPEDIKAILRGVDGFDFAVRGMTFFYWYGQGRGHGQAPFPCGSNNWESFERGLRLASPTDLLDVIALLEEAE